jgi:hypothetical protein
LLDKLKETLASIQAYNERFKAHLDAHPALQEAWDSFACLYNLAVSRTIVEAAGEVRNGCFLCWSPSELAEREEEERAIRRGDVNERT